MSKRLYLGRLREGRIFAGRLQRGIAMNPLPSTPVSGPKRRVFRYLDEWRSEPERSLNIIQQEDEEFAAVATMF